MEIFIRQLNEKRGLKLKDSRDLYAWSIHPDTCSDFWVDLFNYEHLKPGTLPKCAFLPKDAPMFPPPKFFPDISMNFTEHLLQQKQDDHVALYAVDELDSEIKKTTWGELKHSVATVADALRASGLQKGDRVAAVISNCREAVIACLATLSIGAIFSTSSPDMGVSGILDRLRQIQPKFTFFESSVLYNGKNKSLIPKVQECVDHLRKVEGFREAILITRETSRKYPSVANITTWDNFNARASGRPLKFEEVSFSHPGFIVYSSGTTGIPKCIVHSATGLLMTAKKDALFHQDIRPGDVYYQYTTTGWIMWPLMLCGLASAGTVVLYNGSPLIPDVMVTLRLAAKLKVTMFGTSARFLSDLMRSGLKPRDLVDLSSLRTVSSTGSVLGTDVYEWFYDHGFPRNVHLISGSGGTDLAGSLVCGDPTSPVYVGEIQMPALGMAIDILDSTLQEPRSIARTGEAGELVCRMPFPSQPVKFWGNDDNTRYRSSYFEMFGDRIWVQGDFVSMSPITGGFTMLGRSDGVLNPSGVRFGSAEIYNAIAHIPEFEETICVGQRRPQDDDETVVLFIKTKGDVPLTQEKIAETKATIRSALSARHVPKFIFQVPEIPYTINGKKIELAVKQIISGKRITASSSVANPESLKYYERFFRHDGPKL